MKSARAAEGMRPRSYVGAGFIPGTLTILRLRAAARLAARRLKTHRRLARRLRLAAQVAIWAMLAWRLSHVGWTDVARSLPTSPWFYALLALSYAALPVSDVLIYAPWWRVPARALMRASFRKRVYNEDVVEYSGEAAFVGWAERQGVPRQKAFHDIRDNNIISAAVSMIVTLTAAAAALAWSGVGWNEATGKLAALVAVPLVLLAGVLVVLRRRAFALSARETFRSAAINVGRMVVVSALTVGMWALAVPSAPVKTWVVLLAAQLLVSRVPLVPAKDLLFVGVGVSLSASIGEAQAAVAGALIVQVAVTKALNLAILVASTVRENRRSRLAPVATSTPRADGIDPPLTPG